LIAHPTEKMQDLVVKKLKLSCTCYINYILEQSWLNLHYLLISHETLLLGISRPIINYSVLNCYEKYRIHIGRIL